MVADGSPELIERIFHADEFLSEFLSHEFPGGESVEIFLSPFLLRSFHRPKAKETFRSPRNPWETLEICETSIYWLRSLIASFFLFFFFFQGFAPEITIIGEGGEKGWRGKMEKSNARDDEFVTIFTA